MTREDKLIEKLENGDMSALDELISLYYTDILRYCICHTADRQTAEDAVQETFLKTVRYLDRYIHKGKFRAFLYQVAANTCVDMWRKKHQEEQIPDTLECLELKGNRADFEPGAEDSPVQAAGSTENHKKGFGERGDFII